MIIICIVEYSFLSKLQALLPCPLRRLPTCANLEVERSGKVEVAAALSLKKRSCDHPFTTSTGNDCQFVWRKAKVDKLTNLAFTLALLPSK